METLPWFSCLVTFSRGSASILFEVEKRRKKNKKLRQEKRFYSVKRKGEGALGKTSPVSKCTYVCFWNGIPGGVTSRPFVFRLFERGKFWNSPSSKSLWLQRVWSPEFPSLPPAWEERNLKNLERSQLLFGTCETGHLFFLILSRAYCFSFR